MVDDGTHAAASDLVSCATDLQIAIQKINSEPYDPAMVEHYISLPDGKMRDLNPGPKVNLIKDEGRWAIDVTNIVRSWISGERPNYGFVLVRPHVTVEPCLSTYANFYLGLSY